MTGAAWSSSPRSTTCSRALRRRQCRTSTWPSVSRKPKAFHWNDRLAPSPAQAGEGPKQQLAAEAAPTGFRKENNIMSDLLWQKPGVAVDARIPAFLAGDDVGLDREDRESSELQSLMRISYAVFCLKKKIKKPRKHNATYS